MELCVAVLFDMERLRFPFIDDSWAGTVTASLQQNNMWNKAKLHQN